MTSRLLAGDCLELMAAMADNSVDAVVTDPPYGIRYMGKAWDGADIERLAAQGFSGGSNCRAMAAGLYDLTPRGMRAFHEFSRRWGEQAMRVLKPGGHLIAFASPRTYRRLVCGLEDAGLEVRDQLLWLFGEGFPKSYDVAKGIDKAAGAVRAPLGHTIAGGRRRENGLEASRRFKAITAPATEAAQAWDGWGTGLKPAHEPAVLARKPFRTTKVRVPTNVLEWGTGALNVGACKVPVDLDADADALARTHRRSSRPFSSSSSETDTAPALDPGGRWPANLAHDGSAAVLELFPFSRSGRLSPDMDVKSSSGWAGGSTADRVRREFPDSSGSAARFFYCAKPGKEDRGDGNTHPTVKPTELMRWLVRMVTPPGGLVLDPFAGSGTTLRAAELEGFDAVGMENDPESVASARRRLGMFLEVEQPAVAVAGA